MSVILPHQQFWQRQFTPKPTEYQQGFDLAFGILLPVVFLLLDPVLFRSGFGDGIGLLEHVNILAYGMSGATMCILLVWMCFRNQHPLWNGFVVGSLFAGSILACWIGYHLLPVMLFLFFGVGLISVLPFLAAFVYLRNGIRAFGIIRPQFHYLSVFCSVIGGVLCVTGIPLLIQGFVSSR